MNCPYCGKAMEHGTFCDRGGSYFLPDGQVPAKLWTKSGLNKKNAVLLPPEPFGAVWAQRPAAFWCAGCRKLLVDYSDLMPLTAEDGRT